ncbi:hypothetical protein GWO43_03090, partial [candidate division KSB1 bacterium]|nr:hypothetical protein [candidate division KSB1 bacterium]NIR70043.1 hypothetical protein [candidate division KSB1 bacterium]NIS23037.1 hypothetical protein [candidate division KSB1 bacterium]NIT69890.1 hypothetical protein [candidate division KSB1 bacterium]NIU23555.1 hypothetical protein [candidate division KSB1 bacterium]
MGTFNDSEFFYLSLVTNNRDLQRQMMIRGFTLWFDPDGGKDRVFGIRFPLGMLEMGLMIRGGRNPERDLESFEENFEKSLVSLEIIGPDKEEPQMMFVSELQGIELKLDRSNQTFVYEVKVPLEATEDRPFAIHGQPGQTIGVGFEVAEFNREKFKDRMRPGDGGSRPPGGIGGRPGGLGGPSRNRRGHPQMPETFKLWVSVPLVTAEADAQPFRQRGILDSSRVA